VSHLEWSLRVRSVLWDHAGDNFNRGDAWSLPSLKHPQLAVRIRILLEKSICSPKIPQPVLRKMHDWVFNLIYIHALQVIVAMQKLVVNSKRTLDV
jgi:hypothetical protein